MMIDARLPIRFGPLHDRRPAEAVVTDGATAAPPAMAFEPGQAGHLPDCACCAPRSSAAAALAVLFRERAVGTGVPFKTVLAVVGPEAEVAIRAALRADPFASGRYRLA